MKSTKLIYWHFSSSMLRTWMNLFGSESLLSNLILLMGHWQGYTVRIDTFCLSQLYNSYWDMKYNFVGLLCLFLFLKVYSKLVRIDPKYEGGGIRKKFFCEDVFLFVWFHSLNQSNCVLVETLDHPGCSVIDCALEKTNLTWRRVYKNPYACTHTSL